MTENTSNLNNILFEGFLQEKIMNSNKNQDLTNILNITKLITNKSIKKEEKIGFIYPFLINKIKNMPKNNFDEALTKIFNQLHEEFKEIAKKDNEYLPFINMLMIVLFKRFNECYETYNEEHKKFLKALPNHLKFFINFIHDNVSTVHSEGLRTSLTKIISLISFFPTLMRIHEQKIMTINLSIFNILMNQNLSIHKEYNVIAKLNAMCFTSLFKLNVDYNVKSISLFELINKNIEHYLNMISPKTIRNAKEHNKSLILTKEENFFEIDSLKNIQLAKNIFIILFKILKSYLNNLQELQTYDINLEVLLNLLQKCIIYSNSMRNKNDYIVDGLSYKDYDLFKEYLKIKAIKILNIITERYSIVLLPQISIYKNILETLFFSNNKNEFFENKIINLKFLSICIKFLDISLFNSIKSIIFKPFIDNIVEFYISLLEKSDNTVVKIDQNYFQVGKLKTASKHTKTNLLELAREELKSSSNNNFSIEQLNEVCFYHLLILNTFINSNSYVILDTNELSCINDLITILIQPSFSKYLFNLEDLIQNAVIDVIYSFTMNIMKHSRSIPISEKIIMFVEQAMKINQYNQNLQYIYNVLKSSVNYTITYDNSKSISQSIYDFNKKIQNYLNENNSDILNFLQRKEARGNDNNNYNDIKQNNEKEESKPLKETKNENISKSFLEDIKTSELPKSIETGEYVSQENIYLNTTSNFNQKSIIEPKDIKDIIDSDEDIDIPEIE